MKMGPERKEELKMTGRSYRKGTGCSLKVTFRLEDKSVGMIRQTHTPAGSEVFSRLLKNKKTELRMK